MKKAKTSNKFISRMRAIIPDWEIRKNIISREYSAQKKFLSKKALSEYWMTLVKKECPQGIDLGEWKSFISTISHPGKQHVEIFEKTSTMSNIVIFVNEKIDEIQEAFARVSQEMKILGGGKEDEGAEYLEKYLYD